jgi:hypothetical protein
LRMAVIQPEYVPRAYRPGNTRPDHWMATYSLNLTLLILACGSPLRAGELWTETTDPGYWMRSTAQAWRSAVPTHMYMNVMALIDVERTWSAGRRDIVIRLNLMAGHVREKLDPMWSRALPPGSFAGKTGSVLPPATDLNDAAHSMALTNNLSDDLFWHAIEPFLEFGDDAVDFFLVHGPDDAESLAHSLISLWVTSLTGRGRTLDEAYERAMAAVVSIPSSLGWRSSDIFCLVLLLRSIARDVGRVPADKVAGFLRMLSDIEVPAEQDVLLALDQCTATLPEPLRQELRERLP